MGKHSRKYIEADKQVDHAKSYSPTEAIELVKQVAYTPFDGAVEARMRLGVDPRQADQQVRGVAQQRQAENELEHTAAHHQVETGGHQSSHDERQYQVHCSSSAKVSRIISVTPTTVA